MSLQALAQHMAAQGRGPDTMLVHMTPREVSRLQEIARAHGGSLTVNPETGLVEAGFLDDIVGGVKDIVSSPIGQIGLGALGASMGLSPMTMGLIMGGTTTLATGNLGKGLMAGLGAYGTANLVGGLSGFGADAIGASAYNQYAGMTDLEAAAQGFGSAEEMAGVRAAEAMQKATPWEKLTSGASAAWDNPSAAVDKLGGWKSVAMQGAAAAAPLLADSLIKKDQPGIAAPAQSPAMIRPYRLERQRPNVQQVSAEYQPHVTGEYNPKADTSERRWFDDKWTVYPAYKAAAEGGVMRMADGGMAYGGSIDNPNVQTVPSYDPVVRMASGGISGGESQTSTVNQSYANPYVYNPKTGNIEDVTGGSTPIYSGINLNLPSAGKQAFAKSVADTPGYAPAGIEQLGATGGDAAPATSSTSAPGQGVSNMATSIGLGLMGLSENISSIAPVTAAIANAVGTSIADSQMNSMTDANNALSAISAMSDQGVNGVQSVSDASGNISSVSNAAAVNAADAAAVGAPGVGGGFGSATGPGGIGESGIGEGGFGSESGPGGIGEGGPGDGAPGAGTGGGGGDGAASGERAGGLAPHFKRMAMGGLGSLGGYAAGGAPSLGSYSDGGRMLKGPGDGMSDNIPAMIGSKQPARLADGEFVVPADVVSHLGNGSTDAGARQLYKMMDRIRQQRTGKKKQAPEVNPRKAMPA